LYFLLQHGKGEDGVSKGMYFFSGKEEKIGQDIFYGQDIPSGKKVQRKKCNFFQGSTQTPGS
jgi:hypothetical protein